MLTYFFDITMDGVRSKDLIGTVLADDVAARAEANKIVAELVFDQFPGLDHDMTMVVCDQSGNSVASFRFDYDPAKQH